MNYAAEQRIRFIDFLLSQYGYINRSALENYFGISTPQASADIKLYQDTAPENIVYCSSAKRYESTPHFKPAY